MDKSIVKNILFNLVRIFLQIVFPLISFPYVSRILLPEGVGKVSFSATFINYFVLLASFGVVNYGIRTVAKLRDDKKELSRCVYELLVINIITLLLSYALFYFFLFNCERLFVYRDILIVHSSLLFFTIIGMEWLYVAEEDYVYITIRSFVFQLISVLALFFFVKEQGDYINYVIITVFAAGGSNILNFIHAKKYLCKISIKELNLCKHIKPMFIFFIQNLAYSIYYLLDTTMLGFMKGDMAVGLYSTSIKIIRIVQSLTQGIGAVLMPRLSYYYEKNREEFYILLKNGFYIVLIISVPCAIGLSALSNEILQVFGGGGFLSARWTMILLTMILPLAGVSNMYDSQIFMVIGKEIYTVIASILAAVVNFVLNIFLIKLYSYLGAAVASVISVFVNLLFCMILGRKYFSVKFVVTNFTKYIICSSVIIFINLIIRFFIVSDIILVLSTILFSISIYLLVLIIIKDAYIINSLKVVKKCFHKEFV